MDQVRPVDEFQISRQDIVKDLLEEGSVNLFCGSYGDGKSTLVMALGAAIASGQRFLGRATVQRRVLILDKENGLATIQDRMHRMNIADSRCSLRIWGFWGDRRNRQPPGPDAIELLRFARRHKPLLCFDSLIAFAGVDENNAA
jgi:RecA-family ATPase